MPLNSQPSPQPLNNVTPALISLLLLFACLTVTYYFSQAESRQVERNVQTYFDFRVREVSRLIANRIDTYAEVLRASSGLFQASGDVSREDFRRFVSSLALADYYPGIQGVGYAHIIAPEDLATHTEAIRQEGFPAYAVYPEGKRDIYTSIIYLEPFSERNLRAFGYDMYSESIRRSAMQRAADNYKLSLSGTVRLVQESGVNDQAGFLMYMPVYAPNAATTTLSDRQENLVGWAYSVFRMDDFMQGIQGEFANDLDIEIYDGDTLTQASLMFDSHGADDTAAEHTLHKELSLPVVDHAWTLRASSMPSMALRVDVNNVTYINSIGIVLSVSLALILWLLLTGRQRAVSYSRHVHKELLYEQDRLQNIIAGTRIGTWEWNVQTGETVFNEYWANIVGYTLSELSPVSIETWSSLVFPGDLRKSDELLQKHFSGELPYYECEVRMRHKNGHWVWVLDRGKVAVRTEDGKALMMFGTHEDITSRKVTEESMLYDLQHDSLTRIPNRSLFQDRLQSSLLMAKRQSHKLAVMFIDLDNFKLINDTQGHDAGDQVLIEIAQLISASLRESDTVARIGGDEFIALLPTVEDSNDALSVAEKLRKAVEDKFRQHSVEMTELTISVGIALYPEHGLDAETLMKNADIAMYIAKHAGKNSIQIFQQTFENSLTVQVRPDSLRN